MSKRAPTIIDVLDDENLLGRWFAGDSWQTHRAVLKAANAIPMTRHERRLFAAVSGGRNPPKKRVRELVEIVGRRGGKDAIASAVGTHAAAFVDYRPYLRPGEKASIMLLACDRQQAKVALSYTRAYFTEIPMLAALVTGEAKDGLDLSNDVEITIQTNSFRSVRGRAVALAILDEAAFYQSEDSANPDIETYNALLPGMATLQDAGAMIVVISSPYRKSGLLWQKFQDHFGKDDDDVLVVKGPSTVFNPTLDPKIVQKALERDPQAAAAEWLAEFRSDVGAFLDRALIEAAVERGVIVRAPVPKVAYHAFADPSGGASDSFTCGIAHAEGDASVLDCLFERRPPFNPSAVVAELADLLRSYGLASCMGDRYAAGWTVEAFAKAGITYRHSDRDRSAIYADALPLFTSGRARLLDNPRLVSQFAGLERRTSVGGKDRIDHGPGGHDDLCNSASGALTLASRVRSEIPMVAPIICTAPRVDLMSLPSRDGLSAPRSWAGGLR